MPSARHQSSVAGSSGQPGSTIVQPTAPIFNRREKRKLRNVFPRPDKRPQALYPPLPESFINRVTMADGSSFIMTTRSPRPSISLARDVTNHPLWNPSLAREVADQDQSGRMGRFARRYAGPKIDASPATQLGSETDSQPPTEAHQLEQQKSLNKTSFEKQGFGLEDLEWMSGESNQSFYGLGSAKNIKGLKKSGGGSKK